MEQHRSELRCELCGRVVPALTEHHLTPREQGGALLDKARLCPACHRQIHALYTNRDLVQLGLTSVAALRADPAIAAYVRYIRKQPPGALPALRKSARVRRR